ncbi:MAG: hypothetical protein Q7V57_17115 [Actinomycetota bacterium]|nr:hypothetical protein [Actinomycetota bacterium]
MDQYHAHGGAEQGDLVHQLGDAVVTRRGLRRGRAGADGAASQPGDDGMALVFVMVFVVLAVSLVLPMLDRARVVMKAAGDEHRKITRISAATGAMRVALADPVKLYRECGEKAGLTAGLTLAVPDVGVPIEMECFTINQASELGGSDIRMAMATVAAGTVVAPDGMVGDFYVNSGSADTGAWLLDSTTASVGGKIWVPYLPTHGLNHPSPLGYMMPAWAGECRVYFPGTYTDPITIADATPTYFASGVYYFENTVTFGPGANVVVGTGAAEGCTSDPDAVLNAIDVPLSVTISGIGGTFVLGAGGRVVVTDQGTINAPKVLFNARLVGPTDVGNAVSQGVSIISVNGSYVTSTASADYEELGYLKVPKSLTENDPSDLIDPVDAASTGYLASTLVQTSAADATPIVSVDFTGFGAGSFFVPGYIGVPQGRVHVNIGAGAGSGKAVELVGGLLAAKVTRTGEMPTMLEWGFRNRVVQKTFKVVAQTPDSLGTPKVVSVAIVQVNDFGEYAVNSWVTNS